ncbi:glycosyltransferase family 1 protein [Microbacterium sp. G2-8]|uniref:glycosyltransferase family 4 protein n=1 Tax=Microbacterium sp. G2-8 TaxID=2842454 RepID=UPI001C8AEF86|nr:glycosyltransferase family 1 protein [Microbacterium sp. G2-8]
MIWIDTRWQGRHGIGRYAREVTERLTVPWHPLALDGSPASPISALARVPKGLIYSPGYNGFLRAQRQVLTVHDLIHLETPWPERAKYVAYYNAVVKPIVKRSGVVLTVSETSRDAIRDWLGDDRVEVVNAGLGSSPAFRSNVAPADASDPYLMYVGNLRAHKNLGVVLDALRFVPEARLRMLIPSAEHDEARGQFAERGISDRIELLSGLSDGELAAQYRGAAATVMPSKIEGFGLPPLESLMTGTPVIFWRGCTAVAETVGDRGWAIDRADEAEGWAQAIREALSSPVRVGPPTRAYDWDATAGMIDTVLRQVIEERPHRRSRGSL